MSQIIVPTETEGFCFKETRQARHGLDTVLLSFDDCRVPVSNTIGQIGRGFQQQMSQFVVECVGSILVRVVRANLNICVRPCIR